MKSDLMPNLDELEAAASAIDDDIIVDIKSVDSVVIDNQTSLGVLEKTYYYDALGNICDKKDAVQYCVVKYDEYGNELSQDWLAMGDVFHNDDLSDSDNEKTQKFIKIFSKFMFCEMKWGIMLLLSVITAGGIKTFMWYKELLELSIIENKEKMNKKYLNIPYLILFIVLFYASGTLAGIAYMMIYYKKLQSISSEYGISLKIKSSLFYALIMYIPVFSFYLHYKYHNQVIRCYNERKN